MVTKIVAASLVALGAMLVSSQSDAQERSAATVRSGVEARVGGGWNCTDPSRIPPISFSEMPSHGTATIRELPSGSPCNNGPVNAVFYRSNPGFKGTDQIGYQVSFGKGGTQRISRKINVQ